MISIFLLLLAGFVPSSSEGCGMRPAFSRVVNGQDASPHSWPWQVSLRVRGGHICGGSLIRADWILTAAHCVERNLNPSGYTVVVGGHRRRGTTSVQQTLRVKTLYKHSRYANLKHDIALLQLERPAQLSDKVNTICLPDQDANLNSKCYITGWGRIYGGGPAADILQQAKLPLVSHTDCRRKYGSVDRSAHLCAGEGRASASGGCNGDSGGPLACEMGGKWYLHGAVSFGMRNCPTTHYTVFTRVASYNSWILEKIGEDGGPNPPPPQTPAPPPPPQTPAPPPPQTPAPPPPQTPPPPATRPPQPGSCGMRPALSRVVNGQDASPHSWPWQVSLRVRGGHICGGSLIRADWIVTAAHCVYRNPNPSGYTVVVGGHRRRGTTSVQQTFRVKTLYKHSGFTMQNLKHDVAVLQLERPAQLSDKVNTVCLPDQDADLNSRCYITGWGRTSGGGPAADVLQQAKLPLVSHSDCRRKYGSVDSRAHLCAGAGRAGASGGCNGDSGGPLVCEMGGRWYLHGAVSFGKQNCPTTHFTVFARITSYKSWILQKIGDGGGPNPPPPQTPRPPPPTRPPTRPPPPGGCKDRSHNCYRYVRWCRYSSRIRYYCRKTCRLC